MAQLDIIAEGQASEGMIATPRYEPSWFFEDIDDLFVDACLRSRRREHMEPQIREWLCKHLIACGHEANSRGHHFTALAWFESAFQLKDDISILISSVNMRMRIGHCSLAKKIYERLLQVNLSDVQRQLVLRKLEEAKNAMETRMQSFSHIRTQPDELAQLLHPTRAGSELVDTAERERVLRWLRWLGHSSNEAGDYEAAYMCFDCAYSFEHQVVDLISAANMRVKLEHTSPVAEALYMFALSEPKLPDREQVVVERKLSQLISACHDAADLDRVDADA